MLMPNQSQNINFLEQAAASITAQDFAQAERLVRQALDQTSGDLQAWYLLGVVSACRHDHESALRAFDTVLKHHRQTPEVWAHRADAQVQLGNFADGVASYDAALALNPAQSDWWHLKGSALVSLRRFEAALESFGRALALDGGRAQTISARGVALEGLGRAQEALECYRQALTVSPRYATAHSNLGRLLREFGDLPGAIDSLRTAVLLQPEFALSHHNLGSALYDLGELAASIACYRRALELAPSFAECEYSLAVALLKAEEFAGGWRAFESRLRFTRHAILEPPHGLEPWDGEALGTKKLVLVAEAGAGDIIQFTRYAALLNARGIRPLLQIEGRLAALLSTSGYFDGIYTPATQFAPDRHTWCPLMSLPLYLNEPPGKIPAFESYLRADERRVPRWQERLRQLCGVRIGLAWQGNPAAETGSLRGRSMPLKALEPLTTLPGVSLISLQKGAGLEQLQSAPFKSRIHDLGSEIDLGADAFLDTAALMMSLDLVITTDTSIAHLAGALGVPVWVALHGASDWRWFRSGVRSPWYPTMRLFRQHCPGDWTQVIASVRDALEAMPR
jgi:tetratricopeptide (TPR) repeat protein